MGARLSQQNGKKRVSSRLQPNSSKSTVSSNSFVETSSKKPSSLSSQSSEGVIRNGRKFHNTDKSTYWFPNDDEELDRLIGVICLRNFFIFILAYPNIFKNSNHDNKLFCLLTTILFIFFYSNILR
jgi:hypothetical protein